MLKMRASLSYYGGHLIHWNEAQLKDVMSGIAISRKIDPWPHILR